MNHPTQKSAPKKSFTLPEWTPAWLRALLRIGLRLSIIFSILLLIVSLFYYYLASQYDLGKVAHITNPSLILAEDGSELAAIGADSRSLIQYTDLPPHLIDSLLAREDTRFRDHIGIDIKGLIRATVKNIVTMSYQEGASTISMQLVKNTYDNKSRSLHRKFLEIAITLRVESAYTKDQILTHYLNRIYFGSGCHGIEEAANTYFGVPTSQLTLGQSALIVRIIRAPHDFSPFNNLDLAIAQRDQVLHRLQTIGKITEQQKLDAQKAPLNLIDKTKQKPTSSYAVTSIRRHQQQIIDTTQIKEGGLHINSTINKKLNNTITADIKKITTSNNKNNPTPLEIAVIVIENKTGAVRAILGGSDYRNSPYNRALDSKQQLGSSFSPFIYLAALDRGKIPLKNQPIITAKQIGTKDLLGYCTRFGINNTPSKDTNDLYRGDIYATPLQLANAYAIIQNQGTLAESYLIESITNHSGTKLFTQEQSHNEKETVSKGSAINCLKMLGNHNNILITSTPYKHLWIIASDPTHTAVIWAGHDLPKNIPNKSTLTITLKNKIKTWLNQATQ